MTIDTETLRLAALGLGLRDLWYNKGVPAGGSSSVDVAMSYGNRRSFGPGFAEWAIQRLEEEGSKIELLTTDEGFRLIQYRHYNCFTGDGHSIDHAALFLAAEIGRQKEAEG